MRNSGPARFFAPFGLILIIFGVIMYSNTPKSFEQTTGTVTNVTETISGTDNNEISYDVDFEYTVNGQKYESSFSGFSEAPAIGSTVTVYYDPAKPDSTSNTKHAGTIALGMIGVGALALVGGILATVKAVKKSKAMDEKIREAGGNPKAPIEPLPREQLTEYYVLYDGKTLKPGYIVEDKTRRKIYEAPMTKNAAVGSRIFTFTNHLTNRTVEHEVGHTTTMSIENEFFSERSWFKFDGKNVWDVLHEQGIRISTDILSSFPKLTYHVAKNGQFIATIETSGKYVHEEDAAEHKINIPVGRYFYRVWTNDDDLDLLFLTVFAISETEQTVVE